MTVIRSHKEETRTVLDLSGGRCSKNKIKKLLRELEVEAYKYDSETSTNLRIRNEIKIGVFTIELITAVEFGRHKLKDFSGMIIDIRENNRENSHIKLYSHPLFKNQQWNTNMSMSGFKVKHLAEAIHYCQRLDGLKAFL